jgi:hypothetical protein
MNLHMSFPICMIVGALGRRLKTHLVKWMDGCIMPNPYFVKDVGGEDVGPYCSMVEVPWICVDKDCLTYATQALHNFR